MTREHAAAEPGAAGVVSSLRSSGRRPASVTSVTLDPVADPDWIDLVDRAPGGSVFHHPAWLQLLRAQYRYAMSARCLTGSDGRLVAGLPVADVGSRLTGRRLAALPFSDTCPPLVARDAPAGTAAMLAAELEDWQSRRGLPLEVHGTGEVLGEARVTARFRHHVIGLEPDVDAVVARFRRSQVGRGIRRARREGLTVEQRTDTEALQTFYDLHAMTRARLGVPTQPRRFILRFADLFAGGLGFVLLVRRDRQPVAAAVFLSHGHVLTYKYGGSDPRFLRTRPNNLLFMEAIRWGCEHGMRALDLGRTDWGHESLRAFKLAWGSEERELCYRALGPVRADSGAAAARSVLGAVLRRSPPRASRLAGALLYRHAG